VTAALRERPPHEIERDVAQPLEGALATALLVQRVRSSSMRGVARVSLRLRPDGDQGAAVHDIRERLHRMTASLPAGTRVALGPLVRSDGHAGRYVLSGTTADLPTLVQLHRDFVHRGLLAVPGVAEVVSCGDGTRRIDVATDPERLRRHRLRLAEVVASLGARPDPAFQNLGEVADYAVRHDSGAAVRVRDFATVSVGVGRPDCEAVTETGAERVNAVTGTVMVLASANLHAVRRQVARVLEASAREVAPRGARLRVVAAEAPLLRVRDEPPSARESPRPLWPSRGANLAWHLGHQPELDAAWAETRRYGTRTGEPGVMAFAPVKASFCGIPVGSLWSDGGPHSVRGMIDWPTACPRSAGGVVAVRLAGPDLERLDRLARRAIGRLAGLSWVPGAYGTHYEDQQHEGEYSIQIDTAAAARAGIRVEEVRLAFAAAREGVQVAEVVEGSTRTPVVLHFVADPCPEDRLCDMVDDTGVHFLETWSLQGPRGETPFRSVATLRFEAYRSLINREGSQRAVTVLLGVRDRDAAAVVADVRAALAADLPLEAGYAVTVEEARDP
jgi:Cu/Ag efflux pump CusA